MQAQLKFTHLWRQIQQAKGPLGVPFLLHLLYHEELRHSSVKFFVVQLLRRLSHEVLVPVLIRGVRPLFARLNSMADEILRTLHFVDADSIKEVKQFLHLLHFITAWFRRPVQIRD